VIDRSVLKLLPNALTFFRNLAAGAGRNVPDTTIENTLKVSLSRILFDDSGDLDITRQLGTLCNGLGLTLNRIQVRPEEAVGLVTTRRPVLLVMQRPRGRELLAMQGNNAPTVKVDVLNTNQNRELRLPHINVIKELELADNGLLAAFTVEAMARTPEPSTTTTKQRPLTRLWQFVEPDRTEILIVVGFAIGLGILTLAIPIAVQALVNFVAFGGLMQPLVVVGLLLLFFLAFAGAIRVFKFYVVEILQRRLFVRVVSELSARLPRVRRDALDHNQGPVLVNRYFEVMTIQKAGSALLIDGLDIALQASIGLLVLGFYHPLLLLFDLFLISSIVFILFVMGRGAVRTAISESNAKHAVAGALEELLRIPFTYKLAGASEFARARLAELSSNYIDARHSHFRIVLRQQWGAVILYTVAGTALLTLGGWLVIEGQLTLGQLVAAELIVSVALLSFVKFGKRLEAFYDLVAAADKLGTLMDQPLEEDGGESLVPRSCGVKLELRRVSYQYTSGNESVKDFSLTLEPNAKVAVSGPRRSGKSTLAELVTGLRHPDSGIVLYDDIDLRDIADVSIRSQLELVKGLEIAEGTILDNIRLGRSDVTTIQIRTMLERFGILEEIMALPHGLKNPISSSGAPLSRSTALLLILARACVCRPRIIIIDDVLDQIDSESLSRVMTVLTAPSSPWSLLVFTSRPDVETAMDRVVRIESPVSHSKADKTPVNRPG
jgi:ABC-type bacteriocin/lantibiotic exporter with double-glycine peptidase domain